MLQVVLVDMVVAGRWLLREDYGVMSAGLGWWVAGCWLVEGLMIWVM